jgi:hypothetical protein
MWIYNLTIKCHNLYSSPNIVGMLKSVNMKREGYVARVEQMRNAYKISERDHLEDLDVDGRIILERILE